ncbi:MAG TPA: immunoglobulin domain-containing protein [Verrucomicrobiae bacterium]
MGNSRGYRSSTALPFFLLMAIMWQLGFTAVRAAEPVESWAEYPRPAGAGALTSIAFGNGIFVAVGSNGTIVTSSNGMDWTKVDGGTTAELGRVRFVNDRFFVWGFGTPVLMSTDGNSWTAAGADFSDVTYANGAYHSVSWDQFGRSTNLVDWTYQTYSTAQGGFRNIAYGNGAFAANGGTGPTYQFARSSDGQEWNQAVLPTMHLGEIAHQNGTFSTLGRLFYMAPRLLPPDPRFPDLPPQYSYTIPTEGYFVCFSENAAGWGPVFRFNGSFSAIPNKVGAGGPYWVAPAGNTIFYTTNVAANFGDMHSATNWARVNVPVDTSENSSADIAFGNNVFVAVAHGKIVKSNPVTGAAPVRIVRQPQSFAATMGGTATFTVSAQGTDPMTYQWRHSGTNVPGATGLGLTLTNVTVEAAGEYDVVITNPAGSVTSAVAELTVHFADVKIYAGVTLRGEIGDKFKLEYRDQLQDPAVWNVITNVTLSTGESIWIDYSTPQGTNRFYRATYLGK